MLNVVKSVFGRARGCALGVLVVLATLAAPTGALALSGQCQAINNNQIAAGAGNNAPGTLSGTYAIGNQSFGGEQLSSSNYSDFNQPLAAGEVIHFSWTRNSGTGYVHVTLQEQSGFTLRSGSTENITAASGSGSITVGAANDVFNIAVTNYSVDAANGVTNAAEAGRNNSSVTFTISCSAAGPTVTGVSPSAGPTGGGTSVTITGTNFTGTTGAGGVRFGGTNATSYTVNSNTQITAVAPAGAAGIVDVTVTNAGNTSATTVSDRYTYVAAPTVTSVSPTAGPTAGGTTVTITGTGFSTANPTGAVKFGATNATYTINSNTQITATSPANSAGTYDITVTTVGGTSATSAADQYTYVTAPTVTSVSPTAGPTSGGTTVTITGTGFAFAPGTGAVKFGATNATYTINSNTQITATSPANSAGTYDITVATPGGTSATSAADQFTYVAAPTIAAVSPNAGPTMGGSTVVLTGTNLSGVTAVVFGATSATGFTVNSNTQITATAPAGSAGTVNVRATTAGGTSATAAGNQFTYITPGTVSITGIPATMTVGQTVTATVTPSMVPPSGSLTVTLSLSGTGGLTTGVNSLTFTTAAAQTFTVTAAAPVGSKTITYSLSGGSAPFFTTPSATGITIAVGAPVASSFTFGSIVAYNDGSDLTTSFSLSSQATNSPTSYAVGSATTAQGGSVSVDSTGQITYVPPRGFRGNDSFTWTATNGSGTSAPATTTVAVGNPTLSAYLVGSGVRGTALSGVHIVPEGGRAPYSCATFVASGALPAGTQLNADCALTGTPAASGTFNFTVNVTDSSTGTGPSTQASGTLSLVVAAPTLSLSPAAGALPGATAGAAYSQSFTANGGTASYSYAPTAGSLPPGLTLTGGTLSGTPTAVGVFNFTVTATDSSSAGSGGPYSVSNSYSVTVAPPAITLAPTTLPAGTVSTAYSQAISASGGGAPYAYSISAGALPSGLSLNGSTGVISGTPIQDGNFNFTVTATDSTVGAGAPYGGSRAYGLTISPPNITLNPTLANGAIGAAYSATLSASGGTGSYTYAVTAGSLPPGLTLSTAGAITGTPTGAGAWNFTITATDGTLTQYSGAHAFVLTVNAPTVTLSPTTVPNATVGVAYSQSITASGGTASYGYAVTAGALPAGLTLSPTGTLSGTATAGGTFNFVVTATDSSTGTGAPFAGNRAYALTVAGATVVIDQTTLPNRAAGSAYNQTLTASGGTGPYTFVVTAGALPPGWTLASTGELTGTATESNMFNFTITATDSSTGIGAPYGGSRAYSVIISSPNFTLAPPTLSATVGQAYTGSFIAGAGTAPYSYSRFAGTLPPGLALASDGTLSGTPTASGTFNFTIVARDSTTGVGSPFGVASNYNFTVSAPTLALSPATLASGVVGAAYGDGVAATGGVAPYSYLVTAGALPPGLSLNPSTGALSGTPAAVGTFNFTLTATDSATGAGAPFSVSRAYAIMIGQGAQTISFGVLSNASLSASPLTLSASASSGLTVSFVSETTTICTVSGASLTLLQTGTCTIRAEQAGDSSWASAPSVSQSFTVTPAVLVITANPASGPQVGAAYSQSNPASGGVAPYTYSLAAGAFVPGTTVNTATGEVSGTPTVAGSFSYIVRVTDDQPLTADTGVTTVTIAKGNQTISFTSTAPTAVAGEPAYTVSATANSGLNVVFTLDGTSTGCTLSGQSVTFTMPGTCVINANQAGDFNWNAAAQVQQSFAVTANPPTTTNVTGVTVAFNTATPIDVSGSITGLHSSIAVASGPSHGSVSVAGDVITYTPATNYAGTDSFTWTANGVGGASNVATVDLTVSQGAQTITFAPLPNAGLSTSPLTLAATASSGLAVTFFSDTTTICTVSGASLTLLEMGTCTIRAEQPGDTSWAAAPSVSQSFTVDPADLVLTADPATGLVVGGGYSQANPATGGVAPYTYALNAGAFVPGTSLDASTGIVSGTPTVAGSFSYQLKVTDSQGTPVTMVGAVTTVTIAKGSQTLAFTSTAPSAVVAGPTYTPTATATSGLPPVVTLDGSSTGCVISGGVVSFTTPGTCVINADQPGDADWNAAARVQQSFTVIANPPIAADRPGVAVAFDSTGTAIDLSGSLTGGAHTAIVIGAPPAHGTVTVAGDVVTYIPTRGYFGPDSFTYQASGPGGMSNLATVSLSVATPPPPVVTPPTEPVVVPPSTGGGGSQPVTVNLDSQVNGEVDGFRITVTAQHGSATITQVAALAQSSGGTGPQNAPGDYQLVYTPAANFMGTDTVTVVAFGPGGDSSPLTFTFQVAGKAPDLSGSAPSNGSVAFTPTSTLVGGPFQALRITRAPAFGTATVNGLSIVFTPGAANGGSTSLDYVIDLPFGSSAAGRIDLVSNLVPGAQALTARTVQGRPVTVRISNVAGGPFTAAAVVSVSPTTAGTATIAGAAGAYDLTFTPTGTFSGVATVTFSLTNAAGTTNGTVAVTVDARPDPGLDPEVRGVASSQVTSARRFADAQIGNFQRRLRDLHDGTNGSSNGMSLNLGIGGQAVDADNDPRAALRHQLGMRDADRNDPDGLGQDRDREMLGLDLWAGRAGEIAPTSAGGTTDRLSAVPAAAGPERRAPLGFWTAGSVDWGRQDAQGQRDYRFTTQGVTAGVDMRLSDTLILGVGLGYGEDKTKIGDEGSVSNGKGVTGALYASWRPADEFYIDGVVGVANLNFDSRRWTTGIGGDPDAYAVGDRSGDSRFLSAAFGRILRGESLTSEFYARIDARSISLDGFTETGAGLSSLTWDAIDQDSVSANLGATWRWLIDHRSYGQIRPSARIEWSHEFEDIGDQGVRYADWAASPTYLVPLDAWSRDSLRLDLGADWSVNDRLVLGVGYRGGFGDAGSTHGGEIRVKLDW